MVWVQDSWRFYSEFDIAETNIVLITTGVLLWGQIGFWCLVFLLTISCILCKCRRSSDATEPNYGYDAMMVRAEGG